MENVWEASDSLPIQTAALRLKLNLKILTFYMHANKDAKDYSFFFLNYILNTF